MQVFILTGYDEPPKNPNNFQARWLRESAALDSFKKHTLASSPEEADLILFVENHPDHTDPLLLNISRHPVWKKYRAKCFLYHDSDYAYPFMPGIFPSLLERNARPFQSQGSHYIGRIEENRSVTYAPLPGKPAVLFSFLGSKNSPVRERIFALRHERAVIKDTSGQNLWSLPHDQKLAYMEEYGRILRDSAFVLCPAGLGPSSYRLYETLEAGRVPVILSDQLCLPLGPQWKTFSVRVAENDLEKLPALLEKMEPRSQEMALAARQAWENYFSKPASFHRLVEWCAQIQTARQNTSWWTRKKHNLSLLLGPDSRHIFRLILRTWKARLRK